MNNKTVGIFIGALLAVAAGAYWLGSHQAATPAPAPIQSAAKPMPAKTLAGGAPHAALDFTHFRVGNRNVKAILADGDEIWIGTSGGVIRYNRKTDQHRMYTTRTGGALLSNGIFHLSKLGEKIFVGTYGGGLSIYDKQTDKWEILNIPDGLGDAFVYDVLALPNGDIWVATWSGVNRVVGGDLHDRSKWELYTVKNTGGGLPNDWVYGLAAGKHGDVWLATEGGLAHYDQGQWQHWNHQDGLGADYEKVKADIRFANDPARVSSHHAMQKKEQGLEGVNIAYNPNYIVALWVADDGSVWVGTWGGGLGHFDGKTWTNYTVADGLPANHIFMLHGDDQGNLWIGTSNGLSRFDGKTFRNYGVADGLFSANVFSMDIDADGEFWIGSYGGVTRIRGF